MMVEDRHGFLGPEIGNASHRPLLLLALEATKPFQTRADGGLPVLELGMGHGSTPFLHRYCAEEGRSLCSIDNNFEWSSKFSHLASPKHMIYCAPWASVDFWDNKGERFSVVLIDHAPEGRRHVDVKRLADRAQILVLHDTEPQSPDYLYDRIWPLFQYRCNIEVPAPYAHAAAVSNVIDVTKWKGSTFPNYLYAVT